MFNFLLAATCGTGSGSVKVSDSGLPCGNNANPIYALIQGAANWVIGLLGGLAVLIIIISAIQFITSQGNPDAIKGARSRIVNAVVGLILLSLMFVILRFLGVSK